MNLFLDKLIGLFLMVLGVGTGLAGMVLPETILGIQPPGSGLMGLASFILGSGVTFFGGVYLSSAQDKN